MERCKAGQAYAYQGSRRPRHRGFSLLELMLATGALATLVALGASGFSSYYDRAKDSAAEGDITRIEAAIELYRTANNQLPNSLADINMDTVTDPWGRPYQYLNFTGLKGKGPMRKDRNLVPINSDYDLYSVGKDGASVPPLTAPVSQDDIVRANNGGFIGLASDY